MDERIVGILDVKAYRWGSRSQLVSSECIEQTRARDNRVRRARAFGIVFARGEPFYRGGRERARVYELIRADQNQSRLLIVTGRCWCSVAGRLARACTLWERDCMCVSVCVCVCVCKGVVGAVPRSIVADAASPARVCMCTCRGGADCRGADAIPPTILSARHRVWSFGRLAIARQRRSLSSRHNRRNFTCTRPRTCRLRWPMSSNQLQTLQICLHFKKSQ